MPPLFFCVILLVVVFIISSGRLNHELLLGLVFPGARRFSGHLQNFLVVTAEQAFLEIAETNRVFHKFFVFLNFGSYSLDSGSLAVPLGEDLIVVVGRLLCTLEAFNFNIVFTNVFLSKHTSALIMA